MPPIACASAAIAVASPHPQLGLASSQLLAAQLDWGSCAPHWLGAGAMDPLACAVDAPCLVTPRPQAAGWLGGGGGGP